MPVTPYKIEPIKSVNLKDDVGEIDLDPMPSVPHCIYVLGQVRAGKTLFWQNFYFNKKFPYNKIFDIKILISNTASNDKMLKDTLEEFDFVFDTYSEDLMKELVSMIQSDVTDNKYIIILEDIIGNVKVKKAGEVDYLTGLITRYRHIGNEKMEGKLSLCMISQHFKFLNPIQRLNASSYFLMGNNSESELNKYSEEFSLFGGSSKEFKKLYHQSRKEKYDFSYLNIKTLTFMRNFSDVLWSDDGEKNNAKEKTDEEEDEV